MKSIFGTENKYSVIYADPPWSYKHNPPRSNSAKHYKTMTMDEIRSLPVSDLAEQDCVLFMWATYPMIQEALETINSWGFTYKTIAFQWIKKNKKSDSYFFGMGHWTRGNTECCLLAVRGKPKRISGGVSQLIVSAIGKHSEKPSEARDKIVKLMGDVSRIELFARQTCDGWSSWGNEIGDKK